MTTQFSSLGLSQELLDVVRELGYETLTPIQARCIPALLEGKDVIAQSKTGSGKTAAFSIPILQKLRIPGRKLQALVLCPTRELCTQVAREIRKLGRRYPGLQVLILSGGQPVGPQLSALEKGVHLVVGTPGRVMDHVTRQTLDLSSLSTLVLDEADRMLEMGFQEEVEGILQAAPKKRQTAFFSATYPASIEDMSDAYQYQPINITVEDDGASVLAIEQVVYEVESNHKIAALITLLKKHQPESAMVFCNQKVTIADVVQAVRAAGMSVAALHGDLEQFERDQVMAKFRNRSVRILVASDVASRGIDVADLDMVFNFDLPIQPEIYVHRIGRTGRAGKKGLAITFAMPRQNAKVKEIEAFTKSDLRREDLPSVEADVKHAPAAWVTLYISGALTGEAGGLKAENVGKIEIHDRYSYVALSADIAHIALERLRKGRIKNRLFNIDVVR